MSVIKEYLKNMGTSSFFHVHGQIYLAMYEEIQANQMASHALSNKYLIVPCVLRQDFATCSTFAPNTLTEIYLPTYLPTPPT